MFAFNMLLNDIVRVPSSSARVENSKSSPSPASASREQKIRNPLAPLRVNMLRSFTTTSLSKVQAFSSKLHLARGKTNRSAPAVPLLVSFEASTEIRFDAFETPVEIIEASSQIVEDLATDSSYSYASPPSTRALKELEAFAVDALLDLHSSCDSPDAFIAEALLELAATAREDSPLTATLETRVDWSEEVDDDEYFSVLPTWDTPTTTIAPLSSTTNQADTSSTKHTFNFDSEVARAAIAAISLSRTQVSAPLTAIVEEWVDSSDEEDDSEFEITDDDEEEEEGPIFTPLIRTPAVGRPQHWPSVKRCADRTRFIRKATSKLRGKSLIEEHQIGMERSDVKEIESWVSAWRARNE